MNRYPLWKSLVMLGVLIFSIIYSIPNFFPDDHAVQISGASASKQVTQDTMDKAVKALQAANIPYKAAELENNFGLIRFNGNEEQLRAREIIQDAMEGEYLAALNLAPTTPRWLLAIGAKPIALGLDLRGGVHFVLEVDMDKAISTRMSSYRDELRDRFRQDKIFYRQVKDIPSGISISFATEDYRNSARTILNREYRQFVIKETEGDGVFSLELSLSPEALKDIQDLAITQNLTGLRNRVDLLGAAEAMVQRQGINRIVVQLPGVQDTAQVKRIIGRTANLEFRLVHPKAYSAGAAASTPVDGELLPMKSEKRNVLLEKRIIVTGDRVINASSGFDENGRPQVSIDLDSSGGKMMSNVTRKHVKDQMSVVFIELKPEEKKVVQDGKTVKTHTIREIREVINVATIQSPLGSSFRITGLDSPAEAKELALMLRSGALAAPMYFVSERTVGPSLGEENIKAGMNSLMLGFLLAGLFMIIYNKFFGVIANLALIFNTLLLVALLGIIPGVALSLPAMAAIVLHTGMAVDANVLINSRIREELRKGVSPQKAIAEGYERAYATIWDSQITTLIVGVVLFIFGTGSVKGFAITMVIGIITSIYTAVSGSRVLVGLFYGHGPIKKISI